MAEEKQSLLAPGTVGPHDYATPSGPVISYGQPGAGYQPEGQGILPQAPGIQVQSQPPIRPPEYGAASSNLPYVAGSHYQIPQNLRGAQPSSWTLSQQDLPKVFVLSGPTWNVRAGPGIQHPVTRTLPSGSSVTVYAFQPFSLTAGYWLNIAQGEWVASHRNGQPNWYPQGQVPQPTSEVVSCRVCNTDIPFFRNTTPYQVKCPSCGENTPISNPPNGRKFVICTPGQCNALLTCSGNATAIRCPRANCRRTTILGPLPNAATHTRGFCPHCGTLTKFRRNAGIVRCPTTTCRKRFTVNPSKARCWAMYRIIVGAICVAVGFGITFGTLQQAEEYGGVWYGMWGMIVVGFLYLFLGLVQMLVIPPMVQHMGI